MSQGRLGVPSARLPPLVLDRSDRTPLYFQVARHIERAVDGGQLRPGDRLDGEIGLANRFGVSRATMRRAIHELVLRGVLVRKHGVGTQIIDSGRRRAGALNSLNDELTRTDRQPTTRVLRVTSTDADDEVAEALDVGVGKKVVVLHRLRFAGGEAIAIMRNWLPDDLIQIDQHELQHQGLYELLRGRGLNMRIAHQSISAEPADASQAELLDVDEGAPLLTMRTVTYTDLGRPVDFGRHLYRPDRYQFQLTNVES